MYRTKANWLWVQRSTKSVSPFRAILFAECLFLRRARNFEAVVAMHIPSNSLSFGLICPLCQSSTCFSPESHVMTPSLSRHWGKNSSSLCCSPLTQKQCCANKLSGACSLVGTPPPGNKHRGCGHVHCQVFKKPLWQTNYPVWMLCFARLRASGQFHLLIWSHTWAGLAPEWRRQWQS